MERLHIDLAKDAYRATNHQDKYAQMTVWLERREKVLQHKSYLSWCHGTQSNIILQSTDMAYNGTLTLTRWPLVRAVDLDNIVNKYSARFFREALHCYIILTWHSGPQLTRSQLER